MNFHMFHRFHTIEGRPPSGKELFEFAKGDMYVAEMLYTKGHTAEVTGCLTERLNRH